MRLTRLTAVVALAATIALASACRADRSTPPQSVAGGDVTRGQAAIERHGCTSCHVIPGLRTAEQSWAGPPLTRFGERTYVAGVVVNTQENLRRWLLDPQSVNPRTAMPDVGLTEVEALDIVAYLHSLR